MNSASFFTQPDFRVDKLAGLDYACSCGRRHRVPIAHIALGQGALEKIPGIVKDFSSRNVFLIGDSHTYPLAGERVRALLESAGCKVQNYVFSRREHYVTDEAAIGELLVAMPQETDLLIAVGSGTMNDVSRAVSVRCRLPYMIVDTTPSMDGYASSTSAIICGDEKRSVPLGSPWGIVMDTDLLVTAPEEMLSSGVGDVLGKHVTLADWRLAAREGKEHYCAELSDLIELAVRRCQANYRGVLARDAAAIGDMADTLVMAGAAISMFGTSRPCAGSEHQLAHVWEVEALGKPGGSPLHGNFVGFGTIAAILLYEEAGKEFDFSDLHYTLPNPDEIEAILRQAGSWALKEKLGVSREEFLGSFEHAARVNARYTILTYLYEKGCLGRFAETVAARIYGR